MIASQIFASALGQFLRGRHDRLPDHPVDYSIGYIADAAGHLQRRATEPGVLLHGGAVIDWLCHQVTPFVQAIEFRLEIARRYRSIGIRHDSPPISFEQPARSADLSKCR